MKRHTLALVTALTLTMGITTAVRSAHADRCDSADKVAKKIIIAADELCELGDWEACLEKENFLTEAAWWVGWWNDLVGNTSLKIGARNINNTSTDTGKVVVPGKRLWVLTTPNEFNYSNVHITKKSGKAGLKINFCAITPDGVKWLETKTIKRNADNKKYSFRVMDDALEGGFLAVELVGDGKVGNAFQYSLKIVSPESRAK